MTQFKRGDKVNIIGGYIVSAYLFGTEAIVLEDDGDTCHIKTYKGVERFIASDNLEFNTTKLVND